MTTNMNITVFWNVKQCSLVEMYWSIRRFHSFQHSGSPVMEGVAFSEKLVQFCKTIRRRISEGINLRTVLRCFLCVE